MDNNDLYEMNVILIQHDTTLGISKQAKHLNCHTTLLI